MGTFKRRGLVQSYRDHRATAPQYDFRIRRKATGSVSVLPTTPTWVAQAVRVVSESDQPLSVNALSLTVGCQWRSLVRYLASEGALLRSARQRVTAKGGSFFPVVLSDYAKDLPER